MKDKKILLYAGTTEGRKLASYLGRRGVRLHVCVATAYGESLLPEEKNITVTHDRMDSGQMGEFMRVFEPDYVIDATHPYAKEVTKNLKSACEVMQVPYLRLRHRRCRPGRPAGSLFPDAENGGGTAAVRSQPSPGGSGPAGRSAPAQHQKGAGPRHRPVECDGCAPQVSG